MTGTQSMCGGQDRAAKYQALGV